MAESASVIEALRRFLPDYLRKHPVLDPARRRAVWALTHCRTAVMGGHIYACRDCAHSHYTFHSCNHRSCPQCGKHDTAAWVERELNKRIGAPYFMVGFTLPQELRPLFFTPAARQIYQIFFAAASQALSASLANPRHLGAAQSGFTMVLHTWNQRLLFHPHIHCIVPGAGINAAGHVVSVKSPAFLAPFGPLRNAFRFHFRQKLDALRQLPEGVCLPSVDHSVWEKDWGLNIKPFGDGKNIIKYLGTYVCRTAISDSRILAVTDTSVTFSWKDRAHNDAKRVETIAGVEFVARYLRHVLPIGMRAIHRFGYCHPAAKARRERIAFHTGATLVLGDPEPPLPPPPPPICPFCKNEMIPIERLLVLWKPGRGPPNKALSCA